LSSSNIATDRGGVDDVAQNAFAHQHAVNPEAVEPGFLNHHQRKQPARAGMGFGPEVGKSG
jgi:hypothetical protein